MDSSLVITACSVICGVCSCLASPLFLLVQLALLTPQRHHLTSYLEGQKGFFESTNGLTLECLPLFPDVLCGAVEMRVNCGEEYAKATLGIQILGVQGTAFSRCYAGSAACLPLGNFNVVRLPTPSN